MLRNNKHHEFRVVRRKDRVQKTDGQAKSKGENDAGNSNPRFATPQKRRRFSQFFRRQFERVYRARVVQTALHDGATQAKESANGAGNALLYGANRARGALPASAQNYSSRSQARQPVFKR